MFKLVVLLALVAIVAAKPQFLTSAIIGAYPAASSESHRVDVHNSPVVTAYSAPIVAETQVISQTVVDETPVVAAHSSLVSAPVISSLPHIAHHVPVVSAPLTYSGLYDGHLGYAGHLGWNAGHLGYANYW